MTYPTSGQRREAAARVLCINFGLRFASGSAGEADDDGQTFFWDAFAAATDRYDDDVFEEAVRRVMLDTKRPQSITGVVVEACRAIQRHRDELERGRTPALCADTARPGYVGDLLAERARRDPGSFAARYVARTRPLPVRDVPAPLTENEKRLRALQGLAQVLSVDSSAAQPAPTARESGAS